MVEEVEAGAVRHMFAPIQAPRIKSFTRKAVQTFLAEREAYEDAVDAQPGVKAVSYRSCFQASFLSSLVKSRMFGSEVKVLSDLTDDILKAKLQQIAGRSRTVSVEQAFADVKRNVRMDASEPDARLRVMILSASYIELCEKRGWEFVEKAPKAAIKHIISIVQPPRLKTRMEDALQLERSDLKYDYFGFMEYLAEKAEIFEEVTPLREFRKSGDPPKPTRRPTNDRPPKNGGGSSSALSDSPPKDPAPKRTLPPCLNKDCKENHLVKDCPITSKEQAKKLLEEYRAKKKATTPTVAALTTPKPSGNSSATPKIASASLSNTAVVKASMNGFNFACRIDSGADVLAISESIIKFLSEKGIFLPKLELPVPVELQAVDGHYVNSKDVVQICPLLQTMAGPCRLRNIKCYITKDHDETIQPGNDCPGEIILGNPFLIASGLDVKDFLADNIDHLSSLDFGELITDDVGKVGKLGISLLSQSIDLEKNDTTTTCGDECHKIHGPKVCSMMSNGSFPLKDGDDIDYKDVQIGCQDEAELNNAINQMVARPEKNLSEDQKATLKNLIDEYKEIFRVRLGKDPAVAVEPMKIEFEGTERPIKVRQRTYSPEQLSFMKKKVNELVDAGFIYRNNSSNWACAPLVVPKPGKEGFRFTVDLRPVNAQTKKAVWPMPLADAMLSRLTGSKVWFNLDFIHGYWQFPLAPDSRDCQSFHTPFGVYTPNRVLHGATNAVPYFQSSMEAMFGHLDLLIYLDDLLGHARTVDELLEKLRSVFEICNTKGLKLNPTKCDLVTYSVQFCGRIINKDGVKFHPRQYEALTSMVEPTTVGALMELVHGANWMRTAIPNFSKLISPLHELLENNYTLYKSRKKVRLLNRPISAWGEEHQEAFHCLITAIKEQATLTTPDPHKRLCLFTDASEPHWSGVLTQVELSEFESGKPPQEWEHHPIGFISGSFRGSAVRWTMPEKECYAIVASVLRLCHILVACGEFSLFTDHKNMIFMLSPTRFNTNAARHVVHKVQRWAIRLSEFSFTIEHIPGESNVWADILTRWAAPGNSTFPARRLNAIRVPLIVEDKPELPSIEVIHASQEKYPPSDEETWKLSDEPTPMWRNENGQLYIPSDDEDLQLRVIVAAHCGLGGHRGYTTTVGVIKEKMFWENMEADVKAFVQGCLVCLLSASGEKVRRPLGSQIHAEKVNELLHFDYLYVGESSNAKEYILILKDDFSGYVFLRPCKSADAETTASVLMEYFTTFVPVLNWFSDQGSHFKNQVMEFLACSLGAKHSFSTPYVPWSNGTVEAVCKQVLRVMHAFMSEYRIPEADWQTCVPAIQSIINNAPSRRLGNRAPIAVHTGMEPGNPLHIALQSINYVDATSVDEVRQMQTLRIEELQQSLDNMHKEVSRILSDSRKKAVERHNARTHVYPCNPIVGDYVVVARHRGPKTKMSANWVGPRRVVRILSDFTVEVEHLLNQEKDVVHISRVKPYSDASIGTPVQMREIAEYSDSIWYSVEKFKDVRESTNGFEVLVSWKGLSSSGDSWEPLPVMYEDVPSKVRQYFGRRRKTSIMKKAMSSIGI